MAWCDVYAYTIYMVWFLSVSQELTNLKLSPITRRSSFCKSLSISNYTEKHIAKDSESKPIINETLWAEVDCQYFGLGLGLEWKPFLSFSWILERDTEHFQDPEIYFRRCYKYISRQKQCVVPSHWRGLDQTLHKETVKRPKRKPWIIFDKVKRSLGLKTMTAS